MRIAIVWNAQIGPTIPLGEVAPGAHIGTTLLNSITGLPLLYWDKDVPEDQIHQYDAFIVNLFADDQMITDIRRVHPGAFIMAVPDSYMDEIFLNRNPGQERNFLCQLKAADAFGVVSESNAQFYSVFGKPVTRIPMPVGTKEFFAEIRQQEKEDFIITTDHSPRVVDSTMQNVAAVKAIQALFNLDVVYVNPGPMTHEYAKHLGLRVHFEPYMVYEQYARLAARARLGVDMYARHGFGRNELTLAAAGTPCIGASWTEFGEAIGIKTWTPWATMDAVEYAQRVLIDEYAHTRGSGFRQIREYHTFDAVHRQMKQVVDWMERCHSRQISSLG